MSSKFYITTAIPYANAQPHLGHSYEMIASDAIARHRRLAGQDVRFQTGMDENSLNAEKKARELGRDPREYVDEIVAGFRATWDALNVSYDDFVRTTEPRHHRASQEMFRRSFDNGDIYQASYEGYYCNSCEAFYDEADLEDGNCPVHKRPAEWLSESNYFFALSKYQDWLLEFHRANPEFTEPASRRNEVIAFIERGLKDFSVSRASVKWGIPTPIDPDHVIYVWFDALINYVTGTGFPDDDASFRRWWPCDLHVIGKDIWRFHCIYWPAMLKSAGLPLPKKVFVHGFVTLGGEKMSKSRGIYIDPVQAVREYGADAIRFYLLREVPFGQDGDFTWDSFVARYNADLANDVGNLLNRTLNLVKRHFDGKTPPVGDTTPADRALAEFAALARDAYMEMMNSNAIHTAVDQAVSIARSANKYLAETQPWQRAKEGDLARAGTILYAAMEALRWMSVLLAPIVPDAATRIQAQLGLTENDAPQNLASLAWGGLRSGAPLGDVTPLFPRLEVKEDAPEAKPVDPAPKKTDDAETTGILTFDDFIKIDLRVAEVLAAERVPQAEKLLKLRVRLGAEERTLVAGVAKHYAPEEMIGKRIVVVANLKPRSVFGIESQGMLLAGSDGKGTLVLAEFPKEIASGSRVS